MPVDVQCSASIKQPRPVVAAYAMDPDHAPTWYQNIKSVEWVTAPPLSAGTRVAFVAHFLGRRLAYTYEIVDLVPNERLVMRTASGPFPMQTTYSWVDDPEGGTRMTIGNRGEPTGFAGIVSPMMAMAMRWNVTKDLKRLKALLESSY